MPFPIYESKEQIPPGAEDVYEEKDGQWHPRVEDTTGLKTALDTERSERKRVEKELKNAADARAAAERERDALKTQLGDPEAKTAELLKKFDEDIANAVKEREERISDLEGRLRTITLDDKAKAAFVKAGGRPERADAALRLSKDRLDLAEERIVVKDEKGQVTPTSVDDFYAKVFRTEMPELYQGTRASGGGAAGTSSGTASTGAELTADDIMKNPGRAFEVANAQA